MNISLYAQHFEMWALDMIECASKIQIPSRFKPLDDTFITHKVSQVALTIFYYWGASYLSYRNPLRSAIVIAAYYAIYDMLSEDSDALWNERIIQGMTRGILLKGTVEFVLSLQAFKVHRMITGSYWVLSSLIQEDLDQGGNEIISKLMNKPLYSFTEFVLGQEAPFFFKHG